MEKRKLSLKKPAIIAGLVLTLMLAAFAGVVTTGAHAAPVATKPLNTHSAAFHSAYRAAMNAAKSHKTKCGGGDFEASPCTVTEQRNGSVYFHVIGTHLDQAGTYVLDLSSIFNACQGSLFYTDASGNSQAYSLSTPATLLLDPASTSFNSTISSFNDCTLGKDYTIMLLNINYPSQSFSTWVTFK